MAKDLLFRRLCKREVITIGWHLAQSDSRDDFVRDPVGHADYASGLTSRVEFLIEQVEAHRYRPKHLLEVDVPKSGLAVRPGNVLPIEEASLLHAISYVLAPKLDSSLSDQVYSYRLRDNWESKARRGESMFREAEVQFPFLKKSTISSFNTFEPWYEQWPAFEAESKKAVTEEEFTHLTKTDISSYFENIDLRLLIDLIGKRLRNDEDKLLQLLFRVLGGWSRTTSAGIPLDRGIPQGNQVSSFFGNIYLIPLDRALDRFCRSKEAKWFRYVDDVKIFTKSEHHAREAVFVVNEALRGLHLNLQGSKTQILSGPALMNELDNSKMECVSEVIDDLRSALAETPADHRRVTRALKPASGLCSQFTRGLPQSVRGLTGEENRLFRRLLTAYGMAGRSRSGLPSAAVAAVRELPDLRVLRSCLKYLSQLPYPKHEQIACELVNMVENEELPFPYQIGSVLEALMDLHPDGQVDQLAARIRDYVFSRNLSRQRHWLVSTKGIEALRSLAYPAERFDKLVPLRLSKESHPFARRAVMAVLPNCTKSMASRLLNDLVCHPDSGISRIAIWMERLRNERPFAEQEIARLRHGNWNDRKIIRELTIMYSLASSPDDHIVNQTRVLVLEIPRQKSTKLAAHINSLLSRTEWVDRSSEN